MTRLRRIEEVGERLVDRFNEIMRWLSPTRGRGMSDGPSLWRLLLTLAELKLRRWHLMAFRSRVDRVERNMRWPDHVWRTLPPAFIAAVFH